jgi:hypothetical protein
VTGSEAGTEAGGELPETLYLTDYMIRRFMPAVLKEVFTHPERYMEYASDLA